MPMREGKVGHVIGVDTHRDAHTAAILDRNGGLVAELEVASEQAGYERLLGFVSQHAPGRRCWPLEGSGCSGSGLASFLTDDGEWVTEMTGPSDPGAVTAPRATRGTRSAPAVRRSAASTWRPRASVASARRCGCCS
jgi:hypothetical protein